MTAVHSIQATATVTPRGALSEDSIGVFRTALLAAEADAGDVTVDLGNVTLFSAAAMRVVVQARKRGTSVRLVNASALIARSLEVVGLEAQ